jgi:thymidylate synthase (FAD)
MSARYTELPEEFYVPEADQITTQSASNKQMRTDEVNSDAKEIRHIMEAQNQLAFQSYRRMLQMGCPRELARSVLPVATYSQMFGTVNLHNLFHFLGLRTHSHAQYEIRVYALAMLELVRPVCPVAVTAWEELHLAKK